MIIVKQLQKNEFSKKIHAFYRYNLPKLIQLGFDAAADKTFTLWLVSNSPFIKYRALSLNYTDYANQLDQQAPYSTLKRLKIQLLKDPNARPEINHLETMSITPEGEAAIFNELQHK